MAILYVGIDLAQNGFALHGVNEVSKAKLVRLASIAWLLAPKRRLASHPDPHDHHLARVMQVVLHWVTFRLSGNKFRRFTQMD